MYKEMNETRFWIHVALTMFDHGDREETNLNHVKWFWGGVDYELVKKASHEV